MTDEGSYTYRTLTAEDGASWTALRRKGARDFPLGFLITVAEADAMTPERARSTLDARTTRGVFADASLVGYCGYRRETLVQTRHRAEIGPFFVVADHQGCGAAQVLMAGLIAEADAAGVEQLELFVDVANTRALAFYERQGFRAIAVHPDGVRIDGVSRDAHFCIRRIDGS